MVNATHTSFVADDRSYFSLIKKDIHKLVTNAGFPPNKVGEIDLIVSELTSNLQKHATGGAEILVAVYDELGGDYAEIICIDNGPGIADINKVLADGYSSVNTLGHGFGSIKRLSDKFDIFSQSGWGTIVLVRVYKSPKKDCPRKIANVYGLVIAKSGERDSGDGFYYQTTKNGFKILVADGLGHGKDANLAVNEAVHQFRLCASESAVETIRFIHQGIRKTRGMVGNVFLFNNTTKKWTIAGVGNIATRLMSGLEQKNYLPYNGIIGHNIPGTMNDITYTQEEYNQFIACSDGIRSRWDTQKFPLIYKSDPMVLAAAIYKEYARRTDDMSVIICKLVKA